MLKPLLLASSLLLVGCASSEQPKTVPWGENTPAQMERLKANDIEFTVEGDQLLIPQDQVGQATKCCT
ncbi:MULTISPECIES: hypothetical protein [Exiguobacterium]|uniref:hypothetical protein n=1 Tax=Exiguobacterium TaxID=33986 RepID=UPI000285EEBC|nr:MULTISPECIES: hypothetical protein [Exiguobacterium]AFS70543.1 Hypothetical protein Eab7_1424 [Exiguobacterium antarcticum B7]MCT4779617.1 hypothetical protein [Exiguobacterium soli]